MEPVPKRDDNGDRGESENQTNIPGHELVPELLHLPHVLDDGRPQLRHVGVRELVRAVQGAPGSLFPAHLGAEIDALLQSSNKTIEEERSVSGGHGWGE